MMYILAYFIGIQIGLQFTAAYFAFRIARMQIIEIAKLRTYVWMITFALLVLTSRRIQALLSVKIIYENFNKILGPISIDTIIVQTVISICFAYGLGRIYKYLKRIEP